MLDRRTKFMCGLAALMVAIIIVTVRYAYIFGMDIVERNARHSKQIEEQTYILTEHFAHVGYVSFPKVGTSSIYRSLVDPEICLIKGHNLLSQVDCKVFLSSKRGNYD